ncbi:MAG: DUF192 domain-containing protein [Gammaproteobacteria bacterium]|nr:DUF192 domain-containing protein [Gammaproteobacteria bacterium]
MKAVLALAALTLAAACTAQEPGYQVPAQLASLPKSEVSVETDSGTHRFQVWVAADVGSRKRGLMFVRELPAGHGMLFLFDQPQYTAFWMKDTYIPLDLIFIAADGHVVHVAADARPHSLEPIAPTAPVAAVLEVIAGTAARVGLKPGHRIECPCLPSRDSAMPAA